MKLCKGYTSYNTPAYVTVSYHMCLLVTLLTITMPSTTFAQSTDYISYTVEDDLPADVYIGNIFHDSDLEQTHSSEVLQLLSYVFLTQGIHLDYFTLDELSGEIQSAQTVDRDDICPGMAECALRLDIAVQPSKYFQIIKVVINIEDRNDNSPFFPKESVSYEFSEATSPGVPLVPIAIAKDIDSPKFGVVKYRLRSNTDVFGLDVKNSSGTFEVHLTLKSELDREVEDHYRLLVLAKDGGTPSRTGTLTVNIHVLDINDNNPKFESSTYEVNVPENLTPGRSIITIKATDEDIGRNGEILYSFNSKTVEDIAGTFTIERTTGMIYLQKKLDYETKKFYSLIIVAQDQGPNSLPANTRVLINVVDVNDNAPVIIMNTLPENKLVEIEENKKPEIIVVHISIIDDDSKTNGHVECFLGGDGGKFQIVEMYDKEFKIVTKEKLDREAQSKYTLTIECKDYGQPQLQTKDTITVKVMDVNDNAPEFSQQYYNTVVQEHGIIGKSLVRVTAVDVDSDNNGRITYSIDQRHSHQFEVDPQSGEIKTRVEFDRETDSRRTFYVIATDNGDTPKSSTATVRVTVLDIDDHVPKFTKQKYHMNVSENMPPFTLVGKVEARDPDSPQHSAFTYYLEGPHRLSNAFMVSSTGRIETRKTLDREKQSKYKLIVTVQSDTSPNSRDTAEIDITVLDKNDNSPKFTFPSSTRNTTWLSNRAAVGSLVTTLIASDKDSEMDGKLTYLIAEGNQHNYFELNSKTGILTVKKDISSLYSSKLPLSVIVQDSGEPPNTDFATLYIVINSTILPIPTDPKDPDSVKQADPVTGDLLAVIVGCVCGAIVIMLAVVLAIIVFMRRRKQSTANQVSWYTTHPSTTPSKDDLVMSSSDENTANNGNGNNDSSSRKLVPDDLTEVDRMKKKAALSPLMTNGDLKSHDHHYLPPAAPLMTSSTLSDDKDNDSGCADLSQGSNDDHIPTMQQHPKLHHHQTSKHNGVLPAHTKKELNKTNHRNHTNNQNHIHHHHHHHPQQQQRPHIQNETKSRPYIDPIPPSTRHHNVSPSLQRSFAEWLNSEGEQLKSQGHKYRVSQQQPQQHVTGSSTLPPAPRSSPRVPVCSRQGSMKKTVRFTEPDLNSPNIGHCGSHVMLPCDADDDDVEYDEYGQEEFKPSKSDGNIYKNLYPPPMEPIRHYGSLDRRRPTKITDTPPQHKRPVIVYTDCNGGFNIGHSNDGSLV